MAYYKYNEIKDYFHDWVQNNDLTAIKDEDDIHDLAFEREHYVHSNYEAVEWLERASTTFEVLRVVMEEYHEGYFYESHLYSNPMGIVNMYVNLVGFHIVREWFVKIQKVQRAWRECISNPKYMICRRRLLREFEEL